MLGRVELEKREAKNLSTYATLSSESKGRQEREEECDVRTIFQHDRDRIIHSKAFRRLKHKTQVFIAPEGDHYRTRLTHTLEVAQIARTIARSLALNEDLTEAIALGHDLGHPPFGHAGEEALNDICKKGFSHNAQSLRVVDHLELRNGGKRGLNLSFEVRDGILNHTGPDKPSTLEGQIVRIADRIAYINHDIDDAIRGGIINEEDLPEDAIEILGRTNSRRIDTMVRDLITASWEQPEIKRSSEVREATNKLRQFLFENVYIGSKAKTEEEKAKWLVKELFLYYCKNDEEIPQQFKLKDRKSVEESVIDYISGMSDRYAINQGKRLFLPSPWVERSKIYLLG